MRLLHSVLLLSVCFCGTAWAEGQFLNPDGRPGTLAIEPAFAYGKQSKAEVTALGVTVEREAFSQDQWQVGTRFLIPAAERVTLSASVFYGRLDYQERVDMSESGFGFVDVEEERPNWSFGMSVRFWVGTPR